ncbi:MAG: phosphate/phosphite/phosphonate ABC transporter substrate-binding protein [Deltaproteobacteria bacterium]|nr:phosphate/phosphite/phosphonate ABC transporter substrate-binding protein [Deltaproteobacteria bacterium]MBW2122653.1 phosphate/phosphite/phosphonate ABC transporter substrate-binding protein [Deltaproteobacteria bacterium]
MKTKLNPARSVLVIACVIALVGSVAAGTVFAGECENPDTLTYAAMSQERAPVVAKRVAPMLDYIAKVTGKKVDFYMTTSYAAQIEAMLGGFADIANFGPFAYVLATEKAPGKIRVFATYTVKPMPEHFVPGGPSYKGILVSKKGSPYTSIEKIKGAVAGFPDPGSTSGWLVPNVLFTKTQLGGMPLDKYFSKLVFTGSHDANILAVLEGRIDVAFTWDSAPFRLWKRGEMGKPADELNLLWSSPDIPLDPYSYRTGLCPDIRAKIEKAFLTWHEQPESKDFFDSIGGTKFVPMKDQDYDVIRELYEAKKKMKE